MSQAMISLDKARWRLASVWFSLCGLIFIILILQSLGGVHGEEVQRVWSWALPNFLPTLALMISVFAADALQPENSKNYTVQNNFYKLSMWLSIFYLIIFILSILSPPVINYINDQAPIDSTQILETSNLWLGPLQGLVVVALGILFFLKKDNRGVKNEN